MVLRGQSAKGREQSRPFSHEWAIPRSWVGETAFILAGGPSVLAQDVTRLMGRRVIVINSSYERFPLADYLFFNDKRWWLVHRARLQTFTGTIVTTATGGSLEPARRVLRLDQREGLSTQPDALVVGRTSLQGAINLAVLAGATRLVLLGADMGAAPDGRTHHHTAHPWPQKAGCWDQQMESLSHSVEPLQRAGVQVFNASPVSRLPWWPLVPFEETLSW